MARGNIYYIGTKDDPDIRFKESDYYDKLDSLNIDYVKDQSKEESEVPLECLAKLMQNIGADVHNEDEGSVFAFSFHFVDAEKAKQNYFAVKLDSLKKQVNALTTSDVVRSAPALDFIMDNEYGDLVAGVEPYDISLDNFIRYLRSDVTYYVYRRVILMH